MAEIRCAQRLWAAGYRMMRGPVGLSRVSVWVEVSGSAIWEAPDRVKLSWRSAVMMTREAHTAVAASIGCGGFLRPCRGPSPIACGLVHSLACLFFSTLVRRLKPADASANLRTMMKHSVFLLG